MFVVQFNMSTVGTVNNLNSMYIEREIENVCWTLDIHSLGNKWTSKARFKTCKKTIINGIIIANWENIQLKSLITSKS